MILRRLAAALLLATACNGAAVEPPPPPPPVEAEGPKIVVGAIPSENPMTKIQQMQPLLALMERRLGVSAQPRSARTYDDFIQKMGEDRFDIAFLAPFAYVQAREKTGYEAILRPVREGSDSYTSIIIARADGPVRTLADLKGRTFAFADENSTSGYVVPKGLLLQNGIDPDRDFRRANFVGGHDNVVLQVLRGEYDAGAVYNDARLNVLENDRARIDQLRVVAVTKPIPNEPIAVSPRLLREDPERVRRIVEFFTTLHETPEGREALRHYDEKVSRFVTASDADYDAVREYEAALRRSASADTVAG